MAFNSVTFVATFTLLGALVLSPGVDAAGTHRVMQDSTTKAATATQWSEARRPERIQKMHMPPPPQAMLEIHHVAFNPKWVKLEVGVPIGIYVSFKNTGPPGSITSDFRIYLSRNGRVLQKGRPSSSGLRAGRASFTKFQITLPDKPGRYCWQVSLRQTADGRMTLGGPKEICALLKPKPISGPLKRRP